MSETNGYATREAIFARPRQRRFKDVEIDGDKYRIRSLTANESNQWAVKSQTPKGLVTAGPRLIVLCAVNSDGQRIFSDTDVSQWLEMDSSYVTKLAAECQEHAGIVNEDKLEDAEKNSDETAG